MNERKNKWLEAYCIGIKAELKQTAWKIFLKTQQNINTIQVSTAQESGLMDPLAWGL